MGQWIEEMVRQGILTRAPGNIVATSVNPGGGLGWTDTVTGATSPGVDTLPPDAIANKPVAGTPGTTPAAGDLPYAGAPAWINSPALSPDERAWFIEHKYIPPPWAGDPTVPAPLANWLRSHYSGHTVLPDEYYDLYGGDQILEAIRQYDPNARWEATSQYSGEGGEGPQGRVLRFDERLMPAPVGNLGWSRPTTILSDTLHNPGMKYYDPIYGWVTDPRNQAHPQDRIDKWGPPIAAAAISLAAPYLAPALFGAMGVPAAAAGFTSAATGAAAGLPAASIPGSFAAGGGPLAATQFSPNAGRTAAAGVRTGGQLSSQFVTPHTPAAPVRVAGAAPYNPAAYTTPPPPAASTTRIARNQVLPDPYGAPQARQQGVVTPKTSAADPYGFDPTLYNSGGSTPSVRSNDSKLVATNFADDPYRFS
jgi:hypothetical protein